MSLIINKRGFFKVFFIKITDDIQFIRADIRKNSSFLISVFSIYVFLVECIQLNHEGRNLKQNTSEKVRKGLLFELCYHDRLLTVWKLRDNWIDEKRVER